MNPQPAWDVAIVGGGAAGLATAIHAARAKPGCRIAILDGAARLGAKILVSGGGRCNVTNRSVRPDDFFGTSRHSIKRVLAAFTADASIAFFQDLGVTLHEEQWGKLFPASNSARTILDALLAEAHRHNIHIFTHHRVVAAEVAGSGFRLSTSAGAHTATRLVLATGGQSLPKSGSDGHGYSLARALGHSIIPTTPALVPLILDGDFHAGLSGASHEAELTLRTSGEPNISMTGPMLWTHFGISGPAAMDISRCWHRAQSERKPTKLSLNFLPGTSADAANSWLLDAPASRPKAHLHALLAERIPARIVTRLLDATRIPGAIPLAHLTRSYRLRLAEALTAWPLAVRDSRGYNYAEATAGGVPLTEIDPAAMASRKCPGLYLVGEILDVDGRIGGFNFQWAWSSGYVAGTALAKDLSEPSTGESLNASSYA